MAKTLSYRLFGIGKVPKQWAAMLKQEGILLLEEGIWGSVTYLNFRAPGTSAVRRRQRHTCSIALSAVRLLALRSATPIIDVPFTDGRLQRMSFSLEGSDTLVVAFDAALFHDDWSGSIEYRFWVNSQNFRNFKDTEGRSALPYLLVFRTTP